MTAAALIASPPLSGQTFPNLRRLLPSRREPSSPDRSSLRLLRTHAIPESTETGAAAPRSSSSSPNEEATEKYGLEFGLWKVFTSEGNKGADPAGKGSQSKANQAKDLLARYGGAYLATSIALSLISFSLCYLLVSVGVDVQALLGKVGVQTDETGEKVGALALAYAAHKAASPIRFPPTVALTPIVAGWIGTKAAPAKNKDQ
ncbi:hypothetical protein AXF42_Ash009147 [Apostasia shenzhenica]|uniref:DUF1279 domain-containing protein n=1 Tax=Apostasia shenzhenica TaxID=1088818 RepID=A0A2I0ADL9_9ASPA|nr:hypothetical protein AXF42_Ash009147 [Apostasia shenzhenica]